MYLFSGSSLKPAKLEKFPLPQLIQKILQVIIPEVRQPDSPPAKLETHNIIQYLKNHTVK